MSPRPPLRILFCPLAHRRADQETTETLPPATRQAATNVGAARSPASAATGGSPPPPELPAGRASLFPRSGQSRSAAVPAPRIARNCAAAAKSVPAGHQSNASLRTQARRRVGPACRRQSTDADRNRAQTRPATADGPPDHPRLLQTTEPEPAGRPPGRSAPLAGHLSPSLPLRETESPPVPRRATPPLATPVCRSRQTRNKAPPSAAATLAAPPRGPRRLPSADQPILAPPRGVAGVRSSPARSTESSWLFHAPPERAATRTAPGSRSGVVCR